MFKWWLKGEEEEEEWFFFKFPEREKKIANPKKCGQSEVTTAHGEREGERESFRVRPYCV